MVFEFEENLGIGFQWNKERADVIIIRADYHHFRHVDKDLGDPNSIAFYFCKIRVNDIYKESNGLKARKASQCTNILVKILRGNAAQYTFVVF